MNQEDRKFYVRPEDCLSTHGGAGYASGSYWDGDDIICGICGFRITNPDSTGGDEDYDFYGDLVKRK